MFLPNANEGSQHDELLSFLNASRTLGTWRCRLDTQSARSRTRFLQTACLLRRRTARQKGKSHFDDYKSNYVTRIDAPPGGGEAKGIGHAAGVASSWGAVIRNDNYVQALMIDQSCCSLLPIFRITSMHDHLCLSRYPGSAGSAEKVWSTSASVLIAKSTYDCQWGYDPMLGEGDHFGDTTRASRRRRPYNERETKLDFHREARRITRHPKYAAQASPFIDCRCEYIAALCRAGIIHRLRGGVDEQNAIYALDLMTHLVKYQLWNCDMGERIVPSIAAAASSCSAKNLSRVGLIESRGERWSRLRKFPSACAVPFLV